MTPHLDKGSTAKSLRGFASGTSTLRRFYADERLYNILLNEPLVKHCRSPLTDLYECCEHFYTEWCREHPGKVLDMDYEYLSRRCDAVESVRMKLRGYILVVKIAETLQAQEQKKQEEKDVQ